MERRPIASRNTRWADAAAKAIASTGITPNAISVLGMIFGIGAGVLFYLTNLESTPSWLFWVLGAFFVQFRLLANLFDGMVAQIQGTSSPVGELFNEIPDRVADIAILVGFGLAAGSSPTLGFTAAIGAVFVAYVRAQLGVSGVPQQFCGPMSKSQRMATVTVAALLIATGWIPSLAVITLWIIVAGCGITALRRLHRGSKFLKENAHG